METGCSSTSVKTDSHKEQIYECLLAQITLQSSSSLLDEELRSPRFSLPFHKSFRSFLINVDSKSHHCLHLKSKMTLKNNKLILRQAHIHSLVVSLSKLFDGTPTKSVTLFWKTTNFTYIPKLVITFDAIDNISANIYYVGYSKVDFCYNATIR